MGTLEFPNLGRHCSVDVCQLIDFLPFKCDKCSQVFCLDHRSYTTHSCPKARSTDATAIICPICAKTIRLVGAEDANAAWNRHVSTAGCDPSNYAKVTNKKRCPVKGCKEILRPGTSPKCRDCLQETCLRHRFSTDHSCPGRRSKAAAAAASRAKPAVSGATSTSATPFFGEGFIGNLQKGTASIIGSATASFGAVGGSGSVAQAKDSTANRGTTGGVGATRPSLTASDPRNTLRGSAAQRQSEAKAAEAARESGAREASAQLPSSLPGGAAGVAGSDNGGGVGGAEQCPQCGATFPAVAELIMHVDSMHLGGTPGERPRAREGFGMTGTRADAGGPEICPRCNMRFGTVQALILHAEAEHGGGTCTVC
eukprot:TRINITY_DN11566_c0_g1_i1.p1 TRINITY_DN11566_c0_g1~~TRINITY_DN11566_c0_g1_i1.p1  ORF type:complete len:369 (+),score=51.24 TRINITY_DN11566_c0_g1_i1:523-1629(+)